jgi:hypothetical protein
MLSMQATGFNRGFPESSGLALPAPDPALIFDFDPELDAAPATASLQEINLFSIEALEMHFWPLAGLLAFFLLVTALFWVKRKQDRTLQAQAISKASIVPITQRKNLSYKNEMSLMLGLAKQYYEAGYFTHALQLLNTVSISGNETESEEACQLIAKIQRPASNVNHVF